jgi:hypothetical protein
MTTVLITGNAPVPQPLRKLVERGSTSLLEHKVAELTDAPPLDADRIVFWSEANDRGVRRLAERYAKAEAAERRECLVFVTAELAAEPRTTLLSPNELFVWPVDEDRLKMAFLTGA